MLSSTIDFGITQLTPNKPKTIDHRSVAIGRVVRLDDQEMPKSDNF